jgi:serine/threonine protein phosphatase PrpC
MTVAVASCTSAGRVRATNQDWAGYFGAPDDGMMTKGRLFILADGMGGEAGGEVASRLAVDTIAKAYFERASEEPLAALERSLMVANQAIHAQATASADLRGMGTTCTALVLRGAHAWIAHVGDSRAYRIRDGHVERLTTDHSLAERGAAYAHILTRALGVRPEVEVDLIPVATGVRPRDLFLLCSDGLWGQVADADILTVVTEEPDLEVASQRLIDTANLRGGPDNVTVILARVEGVETASWTRGLGSRIRRAVGPWIGRGPRNA